MSDLKNLANAFSFNADDIIAPEIVISKIVEQIEGLAHGLVKAEVKKYEGHTVSHIEKSGLSAFGLALSGKTEVDIQTQLGKIGYSENKFELILIAPQLPQYKFRVLFFSYGIGGYPVLLTVEHGIAAEIARTPNTDDMYECKTSSELDETVCKIFDTKRIITIIQELINASLIAQKNGEKTSDKSNLSEKTDAEQSATDAEP